MTELGKAMKRVKRICPLKNCLWAPVFGFPFPAMIHFIVVIRIFYCCTEHDAALLYVASVVYAEFCYKFRHFQLFFVSNFAAAMSHGEIIACTFTFSLTD